MNRAALAVLGFVVLAALWSFATAPAAVDVTQALQAPGRGHWLGTDPIGRPVAALLAGGAATALIVGGGATLFAFVAGGSLGLWAGIRGGWTDSLVMRLSDVILAVPGLLLALALAAILPPGPVSLAFAIGFAGWPGFARLARAETRVVAGSSFVEAARLAGLPEARIWRRHVWPSVRGALLIQAAFALAGAITVESSLAFLGLGDPAGASWGALLAEGMRYLRSAPWLILAPAVALSATVLALQRLAEDASL